MEKLKHQSELQEARNNPGEEELGGDDAYSEIEAMQARYLVITPLAAGPCRDAGTLPSLVISLF